jgi:hypothetical protein
MIRKTCTVLYSSVHNKNNTCTVKMIYSEFPPRLAIGFHMPTLQPPVNSRSDENIQTTLGTKLEDFSNHRTDYNSRSQTVEKAVKKISFSATKASKSGGNRQVLVEPMAPTVEPTMALLWRPLDVLLFRRPENIFFTTPPDSLGY